MFLHFRGGRFRPNRVCRLISMYSHRNDEQEKDHDKRNDRIGGKTRTTSFHIL